MSGEEEEGEIVEGERVRSMMEGGLARWESESESGMLIRTGRRTGWEGMACSSVAVRPLGPGELASMAAASARV